MKSLYLQSFLQKFLYLLRRGGAAALADAGLAATASVQGGVEGFGHDELGQSRQGTDRYDSAL